MQLAERTGLWGIHFRFVGTIGHAFTDKQANRAANLKQKLLLFLREVISRVKNRIALTGALVDPLQFRLFLDTTSGSLGTSAACPCTSSPASSRHLLHQLPRYSSSSQLERPRSERRVRPHVSTSPAEFFSEEDVRRILASATAGSITGLPAL